MSLIFSLECPVKNFPPKSKLYGKSVLGEPFSGYAFMLCVVLHNCLLLMKSGIIRISGPVRETFGSMPFCTKSGAYL